MSHRVLRRLLTYLCNLGLLLVFANLSQGCGSGSSAPPTSRDVTGSWILTSNTSNNPLTYLNLTQSGNSLSGTGMSTDPLPSGATLQVNGTGELLPVKGIVTSWSVTLNLVGSDGSKRTLHASLIDDKHLNGSLTDTGGTVTDSVFTRLDTGTASSSSSYNVNGAWRGGFNYPGPFIYFTINQRGKDLLGAGNVLSDGAMPRDITMVGHINGSEVTFNITYKDGSQETIKGLCLDANTIVGVWNYAGLNLPISMTDLPPKID